MSGLGLTFLRRGNLAHPTAGSDYILSENRGDPEVFRILMSKGVSSDGIGITKDDAAKVTTIGTWFQNNKNVTSFAEFQYFTGVTSLEMNAFSGCTAMTELQLPPSCASLAQQAIIDCALEEINLNNVKSLGLFCLARTNVRNVIAPNLEHANIGIFHKCPELERIEDLGKITVLGGKNAATNFQVVTFVSCPKLKYIKLPESLTKIDYCVAGDCNAVEYAYVGKNVTSIGEYFLFIATGATAAHLDLMMMPSRPPTIISPNTFLMRRSDYTIYVPDSSVDAYKSAWSAFAAKIQPLSSYQG